MVTVSDLDIRPLTPATWDALAELFGQGGDPKRCWCAFWWKRGKAFGPPEVNRAFLHGLVDGGGRSPGLVAIREGSALGWVALGPRKSYERLEHSRVLARVDDRPVWSIVCFVVSRAARGNGVATALLTAAVEHARQNGARMVEAYPIDTDGRRVRSASVYTGTLAMFERAGFRVVATRRASGNGRARVVVRRAIRPRRSP